MTERKNWGIPDWREERFYPSAEEANPSRWAWEFLRRNCEYRSFWEKEIEPHRKPTGGFDHENLRFQEALKTTAVRFGIVTLADPCNSNQPVGWELFVKKFIPNGPAGSFTIDLAENEVPYVFRLDLPLDIQLESARDWLQCQQNHLIETGILRELASARNHTKKFRTYLRALDAKEMGMKPIDIAPYLYPNENNDKPDYIGSKKVSDALHKAESLRDGGYRCIPTALWNK